MRAILVQFSLALTSVNQASIFVCAVLQLLKLAFLCAFWGALSDSEMEIKQNCANVNEKRAKRRRREAEWRLADGRSAWLLPKLIEL
jgi:hypothetical protein